MTNGVNTIINQERIDNIVWATDLNEKIGVDRLIFSPSTLKSSSVLVYERSVPMFFVDPMFQRIAELAQSDIFGIPDSSVSVRSWMKMIGTNHISDASILSDAMDTKVNSMRNKYYTLMTTTEDLDKIYTFGTREKVTNSDSSYYSVDNPVDWSDHGHWDSFIIPDNFLNSKTTATTYYSGRNDVVISHERCYANFGDVSTSFAYFGDNPNPGLGLQINSVTCDELTIACDSSGHLINGIGPSIVYDLPLTKNVPVLVNPGGIINLIGFVFDSSSNKFVPGTLGQFGIGQTMFDKMLAGDYKNNPIHLRFEDSVYEFYSKSSYYNADITAFFENNFGATVEGYWSEHRNEMRNIIPESVLIEKLTGNEKRYAFQFKEYKFQTKDHERNQFPPRFMTSDS